MSTKKDSKGNKDIFCKIYVLALFTILIGLGLLLVFGGQRDYSQNENRYLEKFPSFSFSSYKEGEFQKSVEKAVTDQFPARDFFTGMSTAKGTSAASSVVWTILK